VKYKVYIISDAEVDILDIYNYVSFTDSSEKAEYLLNKIEESCLSLSKFPNRGHTPPELERIGIYTYKEIHFKPYRVMHQVIESSIYIHCILDGKRELQELLEKRLLR